MSNQFEVLPIRNSCRYDIFNLKLTGLPAGTGADYLFTSTDSYRSKFKGAEVK